MKFSNDENKYEKKTGESYIPSPSIVDYMKRKLQLLQKEQNLRQAGEELSEDDKTEKRNLDRHKLYILNKQIFPAMANLTVFLEYIAKSEELQKVFDDDLEELFLGVSENNPKTKIPVFRRFIEAAIDCNFLKKGNTNNFRLALVNIMQMLTFYHMVRIALIKMDTMIANTIVSPDLGRAFAWTNSFASNIKLKNSETKRKVLF